MLCRNRPKPITAFDRQEIEFKDDYGAFDRLATDSVNLILIAEARPSSCALSPISGHTLN